MVVSVAEPGTDLVAALLLAQGGLVALGLILIDELDNAYGDVYSGSSTRIRPSATRPPCASSRVVTRLLPGSAALATITPRP